MKSLGHGINMMESMCRFTCVIPTSSFRQIRRNQLLWLDPGLELLLSEDLYKKEQLKQREERRSAREVNNMLGRIIADERGLSESRGEEIVKAMRSANQYQVRMNYSPNGRFVSVMNITNYFIGGCVVLSHPFVAGLRYLSLCS